MATNLPPRPSATQRAKLHATAREHAAKKSPAGAFNPYPNRPYPVGKLWYVPGDETFPAFNIGLAQLEYGEIEILYDLPRITGGGLAVNIGHAGGGSALALGQGLDNRGLSGHVDSLDTFSGRKSNLLNARAAIEEHDLENVVTVHMGNSHGMYKRFLHREICVLFIDGDHSYEGVMKDFERWSPMVVAGGLVAFHDTNQFDSRRVIDEKIFGSPDWIEHVDLHVNRIRVFERV
jgi:hypothetical protein